MDLLEDRTYKSELKVNLTMNRCSVCQTNLNPPNDKRICSFCEQNQLKKCSICEQIILNDKFLCSNEKYFHRDCFRCSNCSTCLADGTNIRQVQSKIFCLKCFETKIAFECYQCHRPIVDGKSIQFHQNRFHQRCFNCCFCKTTIDDDQQQVYLVDGQPCCQICYRAKVLPRCSKCFQVIDDQQSIVFQEKKYHQQCLTCYQCQQILRQQQIPVHQGNPFCSQCYRTTILPQCSKCLQPIEDQQSTVFQGNKYHQQCFTCVLCGQIMIETRFYIHNEQACCSTCYQTKILPKCCKCFKPIDTKYTKFQNHNYHFECFRCSICKKIIENNEKCDIDQQGNIRCSTCFI